MIFGMTFWGFVWLLIKIIIAVSVGIFLIKVIFSLLIVFVGILGIWWKERKK